MIKKISHIGIAVENLEGAKKFFEENFSLPSTGKENFGELLFSFISFEGEGARLELLQSTTDEGQMAKFIGKRGPGIHHIALETDDIQAELDRLQAKGIQLINQKPYRNAHQELVAFLHPKSTNGVLIELIQR
ncbi:MAG: methylmalonyl-CoA epimerase [Betaproteobacteria bacterium RIFCSPLOWO2_02_FULL_64_12]|nr:MAG: methylmalonyl-CoA epimerase [Betaproteobacteria bacterium RIFCSPLOWO2_02_FULL_64_12]